LTLSTTTTMSSIAARAGRAMLWTIIGYVSVAFVAYWLVLWFSSSADRELEAAMTSVFFFGPVGAIIGFIAGLLRRPRSKAKQSA
jgi:lipid-A-disaccharide synthase-like uncharacterized protein